MANYPDGILPFDYDCRTAGHYWGSNMHWAARWWITCTHCGTRKVCRQGCGEPAVTRLGNCSICAGITEPHPHEMSRP